jgi:transposase
MMRRMANFVDIDREQRFLMPPSLAEWLPRGHLAWFVLDVVEQLDLSVFYETYRDDGRGGAAYEPSMMVALLMYAYAVGERSSRRIERFCTEDVAFRVICANVVPDHATIARFRARHEGPLADLFEQVLGLCVEAGLAKVGTIVIDATKVAANASRAANRSPEQVDAAISAQVARILAEARQVDEAEDERFGDGRGDELPDELADRDARLARLRNAKARLDARKREADAGSQQAVRVNISDPDSRILKTANGSVQRYNAQAAISEDQVIVAAEVPERGNDVESLDPMLAATRCALTAAGAGAEIEAVVADAGYYSSANATLETDCELLIAPTKAAKVQELARHAPPAPPPQRCSQERRVELLEALERGKLTVNAAAQAMDLHRSRVYGLRVVYRAGGADALPQPRGQPRVDHAGIRHRMATKLATPRGRARYRLRHRIEAVFGQIKSARGIRGFQRRGLPACQSEWRLITTSHNVLKLHRALRAVP